MLLATLALTPLLFVNVQADELSNDRDMNVLWADNAEFQQANQTEDQIRDQANANMTWSDDADFQRVNRTEDESDYIHANVLWSDKGFSFPQITAISN